jgi:hypothetical protein
LPARAKKIRVANANNLICVLLGEHSRPRLWFSAPSRQTLGVDQNVAIIILISHATKTGDEGVAGCARGGRAPQTKLGDRVQPVVFYGRKYYSPPFTS